MFCGKRGEKNMKSYFVGLLLGVVIINVVYINVRLWERR